MSEDKFEKSEIDEPTLLAVLADAQDALKERDIPFVLIGGIPSAVYGRPRATQDLDLFVRPEDKDRALDALAEDGFETEKKEPEWLYKAAKKDVLCDVIFRAEGDFYLDEAMIERAVDATYKGEDVRLVPREDLIIMKVVAHAEEIAHYWHDAMALLLSDDIDWDYLVDRARHGTKRLLSLLIYAQSSDLLVPDEIIHRLYNEVYR
ncbi:MAG: nucleotidyltransferase family protein [Actinobacteria bacterium]|nr:nucleotidyltransferase family protein [Actinomycetota bacterium]